MFSLMVPSGRPRTKPVMLTTYRAYAVCRVKCFYCIWVKYHLHETFTVTHIKKYDTTVIAATVYPATKSYVLINQAFVRSEEHTSELQSRPHLVCRLLLEKKKKIKKYKNIINVMI